jgi:hypothetical protein
MSQISSDVELCVEALDTPSAQFAATERRDLEICLTRYGAGAESVGRNVEVSTPVELQTLRRSTIHFAQSPAPIAQPSFAQVLDSVARTNATLASQMPVSNAKAIPVPGPSRLES